MINIGTRDFTRDLDLIGTEEYQSFTRPLCRIPTCQWSRQMTRWSWDAKQHFRDDSSKINMATCERDGDQNKEKRLMWLRRRAGNCFIFVDEPVPTIGAVVHKHSWGSQESNGRAFSHLDDSESSKYADDPQGLACRDIRNVGRGP